MCILFYLFLLQRDHHCSLVRNCIGFRNIRVIVHFFYHSQYFVLLTAYSGIYGILNAVISTLYVFYLVFSFLVNNPFRSQLPLELSFLISYQDIFLARCLSFYPTCASMTIRNGRSPLFTLQKRNWDGCGFFRQLIVLRGVINVI